MAVGTLVKRKRELLGLTQTELALRSGLRQVYISQVERGDIQLPRPPQLDTLGLALGISRAEFYQAAGMFAGLGGGAPAAPAPPAPAPDDNGRVTDIRRMVAFVESRPGDRYQQNLARLKEALPPARYDQYCVRIFRAWEANSDLAIESFQFGADQP